MGLPGITRNQMREVDRLMMEEYHIPVELMMEHAGLNLARLAMRLSNGNSRIFQVIAGSGNNGGGGLVAARRLAFWNLKTEVYFPKGIKALYEIPMKQSLRLRKAGVPIFDGTPPSSPNKISKQLVLDCYIGYGFKSRLDEVTNRVFTYLRNQAEVISLDAPSGLDVTSGRDSGKIRPRATMTIAFVKQGLLKSQKGSLGDLFLVDIGVPSDIYRHKLGIKWTSPFDINELNRLTEAFRKDTLQKVLIYRKDDPSLLCWNVQ